MVWELPLQEGENDGGPSKRDRDARDPQRGPLQPKPRASRVCPSDIRLERPVAISEPMNLAAVAFGTLPA